MTNTPTAKEEALLLYQDLYEVHLIACAACQSLKFLESILMTERLSTSGYTFNDIKGCIYSIEQSIHTLDLIIHGCGIEIESDPLYPERLERPHLLEPLTSTPEQTND
jgi:hypothetical protein